MFRMRRNRCCWNCFIVKTYRCISDKKVNWLRSLFLLNPRLIRNISAENVHDMPHIFRKISVSTFLWTYFRWEAVLFAKWMTVIVFKIKRKKSFYTVRLKRVSPLTVGKRAISFIQSKSLGFPFSFLFQWKWMFKGGTELHNVASKWQILISDENSDYLCSIILKL